MTKNTMYHLTHKSNLKSIMTDGLIPQIGANSLFMDESAAVFLFKTESDMRKAMFGWLNMCFETTDQLVSIAVNTDGLDLVATNNPFEVKVISTVTPNRLHIHQDEQLVEYAMDKGHVQFDIPNHGWICERNQFVLRELQRLGINQKKENMTIIHMSEAIAAYSINDYPMTPDEVMYRIYSLVIDGKVAAIPNTHHLLYYVNELGNTCLDLELYDESLTY